MALLLMIPVAAGVAAGAAAIAPRDAPAAPLFPWVPAGGFTHYFPYGECTWWAAYNRRVTWNGNAGEWLANASAQGYATASAPTVGSIAVFHRVGAYSELGHVAVVIAVTATTYTVSEMNAAAGRGRVNTRIIPWPDAQVQGFIPLSENETAREGSVGPGPR